MTALAVHLWPGPAPTPQDGLFAILIRTADAAQPSPAAQRDAARRAIRLAAREALAAVLGVPIADITIASSPGTPPAILLAERASIIGCSFSHDTNYTLAAFNLRGPIGADLIQVQDIPDWQTVARDYLGPHIAAALQTAADKPRAFTQAWTQREAALKCHAQQISEWQADLPGRSIPLALPVTGLLGHIHIGDRSA
ncbi:4'-phosphopantetheinyl transferase [Duganella sp. CF402]|uniref:4'-phosphopantetheinyl transferase superfamily protein n=1 Tax=unclassified Duganella TaxID=2636909 RepID=UPI0008CA21F9|nr:MULTISPECIES: 4'-phosphopantetheinyl transferase superfamily protein [unclassified Duganella]RZT09858.1 4'-phosphopantetheinyl transferase [Duganella sp. BK701]SEL39794.1 4'-phosphopantetheinyl transferase [Duganella sp. CF402]